MKEERREKEEKNNKGRNKKKKKKKNLLYFYIFLIQEKNQTVRRMCLDWISKENLERNVICSVMFLFFFLRGEELNSKKNAFRFGQ